MEFSVLSYKIVVEIKPFWAISFCRGAALRNSEVLPEMITFAFGRFTLQECLPNICVKHDSWIIHFRMAHSANALAFSRFQSNLGRPPPSKCPLLGDSSRASRPGNPTPAHAIPKSQLQVGTGVAGGRGVGWLIRIKFCSGVSCTNTSETRTNNRPTSDLTPPPPPRIYNICSSVRFP